MFVGSISLIGFRFWIVIATGAGPCLTFNKYMPWFILAA